MENSKNIKRTAEDYAGTLEDLKNKKNDWWYLIIRWRYKAALGEIILNEFLDWTNDRPIEFTERDIIRAIEIAWWREFRDYEYDWHRWEPDWYFIKETLKFCLHHNMLIEIHKDAYRRKIFETLDNKE